MRRSATLIALALLVFSNISFAVGTNQKNVSRVVYAGQPSSLAGHWYFTSVPEASNPFRIRLIASNANQIKVLKKKKPLLISFNKLEGLIPISNSDNFEILQKRPSEQDLQRGIFRLQ